MADLKELLKQSGELKDTLKKLTEKADKLEKEIADAKGRQSESDQPAKNRKR